jgi:hypothetical protein
MSNNDLFSANCLRIYHTPALGDTSYDTLAFEFKVSKSLLPYRTVLLGEMLFSKKELQEGHFEDIIIGEHFNCNEHSA